MQECAATVNRLKINGQRFLVSFSNLYPNNPEMFLSLSLRHSYIVIHSGSDHSCGCVQLVIQMEKSSRAIAIIVILVLTAAK